MKPSCRRWRLAGIVVVAAVTAACTVSPPDAWPPALHANHPPEVACTALPNATAPVIRTSGQRSPLDMPPVAGGLADVTARSSSSALAIGATRPRPPRSTALVAVWNGATWKTLSDRALPPKASPAAGALFPGGAWVVGEYGLTDRGDGGGVGSPLILRVTGTTMRRVPVPKLRYSSALEDVAASSATDAWAVGFTGRGPLVLHWNGTAWTRTQLPATLEHRVMAVDAVAATSAVNAWAVIRFRTGSSPRLMHWNGSQWGDVVMPDIGMRYGLYGVAATSARNVWAVGAGAILHWNGRTWSCASISNTLYTVSTSSADNTWAVGGGAGEAVALHWNGHTWQQQVLNPSPHHAYFLQDVAIIPRSGRAWAVGSTESAANQTLMFHWNGTAWH
ncbi:MAG TPA: hypothetical protein VJT16_20810 [Streptosporangiaceae bacterium]|nr:hypothetical protein [Streptosporangiaceae bacterium]